MRLVVLMVLAVLLVYAVVPSMTSSSRETPAVVVAAPAPAGLATTERDAVRIVDEFWRREFAALFHQPYSSPRVLGAYSGTGGPPCAGQPSKPNNAFYCQSQDFIAWDSALMRLGFEKVGNPWVYLIIAHEWAHAVQARINRALVSTAAELQADCLAGATLAGAQRNGLITLQPGDNERLGQTLTALADKYPWTNKQGHGDAGQRIASFNVGSQHGVTACLAA